MVLEAEKVATPKDLLTTEYAAHLLFLSFPYSQGDPLTQDYTFKYFHQIHDSWRLTNEQTKAISAIFIPRARLFIWGDQGENKPHKGKLHTDRKVERKKEIDIVTILDNKGIKFTSRYETRRMRAFLAGSEPASPEDIMSHLFRGMIGKDHEYLVERDGRPRGSDRWLSYFCAYVLEGRPAGAVEYARMFADLREYFINIDQTVNRAYFSVNREYLSRTEEVVERYLETHPDSPLQPEFPYIRT